MSAQQLLLYVDARFISPYAMSVFVALHEKSLRFEMIPVDLAAKANEQPPYAAASLTQRVPTLVHDQYALSESSAIAEYLDEVFPDKPLYPTDPRSRGRARQIQAWLRSDLMPIRDERSTEVLFYGLATPPLSDQARASAEKLFSAAETLLAPNFDHLFGAWCIADTDLALMLNRLAMSGDQVPEHLAAYARRQWQRPSVRLWVDQPRPSR